MLPKNLRMKSCVIFICSNDGKKASIEPYYYDSCCDSVTHWRHGYHPGALFGIGSFVSEETGEVYLPGLIKPCKVPVGILRTAAIL